MIKQSFKDIIKSVESAKDYTNTLKLFHKKMEKNWNTPPCTWWEWLFKDNFKICRKLSGGVWVKMKPTSKYSYWIKLDSHNTRSLALNSLRIGSLPIEDVEDHRTDLEKVKDALGG